MRVLAFARSRDFISLVLEQPFNKIIMNILCFFSSLLVSLGVGLGASRQFSPKEINPSQPRNALVVDSEQVFDNSSRKVAIAKGVNNDGRGYFYYDSITLEDSAYMGDGDTNTYYVVGKFTFNITGVDDEGYTSATSNAYIVCDRVGFISKLVPNGGGLHLERVFFYNDNNPSVQYTLYDSVNGVFNGRYSQFFVEDLLSDMSGTLQEGRYPLAKARLLRFFDFYSIGDTYFDFVTDFNYHAPFSSVQGDNPFIYSTLFNTSDSVFKEYKLSLPFVCFNGLYDKISLLYLKAQGSYYKIGLQTGLFTGSSGGYYMQMYFINSVTGSQIVVNSRNFETFFDNGALHSAVVQGSSWYNDRFTHLDFLEPLDEMTETTLGRFNTEWGSGYYSNTTTTNVGLGAFFSLLSQAFSAWLPIFSMEVLPGISLGLLIFTPLIVGIIILIIWLVKR